MAINLAASSYLEYSFSALTAAPFTFACWGRKNNVTDQVLVMQYSVTANSDNSFALEMHGAKAGDPIELRIGSLGASGVTDTTGGFSANVWSQIGCSWDGSTATMVLQGAVNTSAFSISYPAAMTKMILGAFRLNSAYSNFLVGDEAEAAVWSAVLSAAEWSSLSKGFSPRRIRPQSLLFHAPLVRNTHDVRGATSLSLVGTATGTDHPRQYGF